MPNYAYWLNIVSSRSSPPDKDLSPPLPAITVLWSSLDPVCRAAAAAAAAATERDEGVQMRGVDPVDIFITNVLAANSPL